MAYMSGKKPIEWIKKRVGTSERGNPIVRNVLRIVCSKCSNEYESENGFKVRCPACGTRLTTNELNI